MMSLYTSTKMARDVIAILYYSIVLTGITVFVAICIGTIQLLSLIDNTAHPEGPFWDGLHVVQDHYDIIGGAICGAFVVFGGLSVLLYKPWRKWADPYYGEAVSGAVEAEVEYEEHLIPGSKSKAENPLSPTPTGTYGTITDSNTGR
jgi:high-affinity nickel-transport protein